MIIYIYGLVVVEGLLNLYSSSISSCFLLLKIGRIYRYEPYNNNMKTQTSLLLTHETFEWTKKAALQCGRSMSGYIEFLLVSERKRLNKIILILRCLVCSATWSSKVGSTCPTCKDAGVPVEYEEK